MRNTRLILGAITLVIGLAGAVSNAVASRVGTLAKVLVTTVGKRHQTCVTIAAPCVQGTTATCRTQGASARTVWTINSHCSNVFLRV